MTPKEYYKSEKIREREKAEKEILNLEAEIIKGDLVYTEQQLFQLVDWRSEIISLRRERRELLEKVRELTDICKTNS